MFTGNAHRDARYRSWEAGHLMQDRSSDRSAPQSKTGRELVWTVEPSFTGWTCSQCEWNNPLPTLLSDPEARTAFDRLATAKFRDHDCADHRPRLGVAADDSFTARIRKLISHGFKPKDAVDLLLQEVAIEYPGQPKILAQAKAESEDFLRRLRVGLI